ncbi:MAG: hypothetical protein AAGA62_08605 [Bacteroidota bacterium]
MRGLILLLFPVLLVGCRIPNGPLAEQPWVTHSCPPGSKNYSPGHRLAQQSVTEGYDFSFVISADDWYAPELLGKEAKDWLKAGGVSYFSLARPGTYAKNRLSALVAFRMTANRTYEACAYVNDAEGNFRFDGVRKLPVGDTIHVQYRLIENSAVFNITHRGKTITSTFNNFEHANRQLSVGPWHGGSLPAPVPTRIQTRISWID